MSSSNIVSRKEAIRILKHNFNIYTKNHISIVDAQTQKRTPFIINKPQKYLLDVINRQKREKGRVRINILKGRRQGFSTFIAYRMLHKTIYNQDFYSKIMGHKKDSSQTIFGMVKSGYESTNEHLKPIATKKNESVLRFDSINSQINVNTAGGSEVGRSENINFFHGSEVAFWENGSMHGRSILNAVPKSESEIYLESTPNGMTGDAEYFYNMCMKGLENNSDNDFETIFIKWFWTDHYREKTPKDFKLKTHVDWCEEEYKARNNLDDEQIYWARKKVSETDTKKFSEFATEYPTTLNEAFESSGEESFIENSIVVNARKREPILKGEKTLGVDVGGDSHSSDSSVIALRHGDNFKIVWEKKGCDRDELLQIISDHVRQYNPDKIRIDITGIGYNLDKDLIKLCNMRNIYIADCQGVNFGSGAVESHRFVNKRMEMYFYLREALIRGSCDNDSRLHRQLTSCKSKKDNSMRHMLESKKGLSESPDLADAMALCCVPTVNHMIGLY